MDSRTKSVKPFAKVSIEDIRRRELIEAAYLTFLEHGLNGTTMARIGERAGMSHGIVNYYFKSKDELLSAVVRKSMFMIFGDMAKSLRVASSPRERVSAIIQANLSEESFTGDIARAWVSFYAYFGKYAEFDRIQRAFDRRVLSNLRHDLRALVGEANVERVALSVAALIDGLWIRHAKIDDRTTSAEAISLIETYVDREIEAYKAGL
ncbi:MAG: transcriptional regulator BetI [Hyphomicrobiales bacterium]|jgi:transcriptional repressor BetI